MVGKGLRDNSMHTDPFFCHKVTAIVIFDQVSQQASIVLPGYLAAHSCIYSSQVTEVLSLNFKDFFFVSSYH